MRECFIQTRSLLILHSVQDQTEETENVEKINVKEEGKKRDDDPYIIGEDGWIIYDAGIHDRTKDATREQVHRVLTTRLKNVIRTYQYSLLICKLNSP
jgi:hypothetical protein